MLPEKLSCQITRCKKNKEKTKKPLSQIQPTNQPNHKQKAKPKKIKKEKKINKKEDYINYY